MNKKALQWIVGNTLITGMLVGGILLDNPMAYVAATIMWINTFFTLVAGLWCNEEKHRQMIKKSAASVPEWLNISADMAQMVFLGYHGWVALAVAVFFQNAIQTHIHATAARFIKEDTTEAQP